MRNGRARSIGGIILLSIFTCGIYPLVWYYEVSGELQDALNRRDTAPLGEVALIVVTLGLYVIYWWYKYGTMMAELQARRGLPVRDNAALLTVLSALGAWYGWLDLINMAIFQSDLNTIWETPLTA